mmetsp:Transcript_96523/g.278597  ORF Transcript_96523/g.278597 Transcript_96523/m.278597 type:complete len:264 (+) Transcript_96523:1599-2390(+)
MSILTDLMYDGSLYLQKNCLKSATKTSTCIGPRAISAWTCTSTVYASSGVGEAISVRSGPFRRRRTSTWSEIRLLVKSIKTLVTERTTALLDCLSKPSRMFMTSNISPSFSTRYFASIRSTAHWPHSENWCSRFSILVIISFVGMKPPSSTSTSSKEAIALATTWASLSWISLLRVVNKSLSKTALGEMWKTLTTPMTAVFLTYPFTSSSARCTAGCRYSTMFRRLREQSDRSARPRIIGSSSLQSFCNVFTARIASSELLSA